VEEKSPEQAPKVKEEPPAEEAPVPKKITVPSCNNQSALQAHVKTLSELVVEYQRKDKS
jgi:hypothetical protein